MKITSKKQRTLVTGGAGFIGTHLINRLISINPTIGIDLVDNLSNSAVSLERVRFLKDHGIRFFQENVSEFVPPKNHLYRRIYHLGNPVGPANVLRYAGEIGATILNDALKMADLALRDKARLLCVSTSELYGQDPIGNKPQLENLPKIVPANVTVRLEYGVGKLIMEIALLNLAKIKPLQVNFIRPFNIVGPSQNSSAGFVLPRFISAALVGKPLTVFGDGSQKRTFTHIDDMIQAMIRLMESDIRSNIYNIGNPQNFISIRELADKTIKLSGSNSKIKKVDPKSIYGPLYENAWTKIPDISRATKELGWTPKYYLDDIIRECIDFEIAKTQKILESNNANKKIRKTK